MDQQKNNGGDGRKRITAVVAAYNEAPRIGVVLDVLATYPGFREVIVVDDGSTDGTEDAVRKWNVRLVRNTENRGKGYAMDRGVALAAPESDIIFFSDADIAGLTHEAIDGIVTPLLRDETDMFIGMSDRKWYVIHQILSFVPLLGGERAVRKSLWHRLPAYYKRRFRIEVALNFYALYYGRGYRYAILHGVSQTVKEKKYGFVRGVLARLRMLGDIFFAQLRLNVRHTPQIVRKGRWLALAALYGAAGTIAGTLIFLAIYFGPREFVRYLFAEKLRDPTAHVAHLLFDFASATAPDTMALIGLLLFTSSVIIFLLTWKNLSYLLYGFVYKLKNGRKDEAEPTS